MKTRNGYIKNLAYNFFSNFGKLYLSVDYDRNGEHNHYTYSNVSKKMKHDEKTVRKYINK
jgi:hypothetical protein